MKKYIILLISAMLLTACHHDDDDKDDTISHVVIVYASNNNVKMSLPLLDDIREMMNGSKSISNRQKVLVFVTSSIQNPFIYEIANGDTTRIKTYTSGMESSDPNTMRQVLKDMMNYYPAESYGLVLWGHATGWEIVDNTPSASRMRAYGVEHDKQWMNIPDLAQALADIPHKMRYILSDCCCMQCVEDAYELKDVTDYLIASPAEIPDKGADYSEVIPLLCKQSPTFYQDIVDSYNKHYSLPMSVVKTSEMDYLAQATHAALSTFLPAEDYPDVDNVTYYYNGAFFDIQHFMLKHTDDVTFQNWKKALDQAVIYKVVRPSWVTSSHVNFSHFTSDETNSCSLSMFVPMDVEKSAQKYRWQIDRSYGSIDKARNFFNGLNTNIDRMRWYDAAGLKQLGW